MKVVGEAKEGGRNGGLTLEIHLPFVAKQRRRQHKKIPFIARMKAIRGTQQHHIKMCNFKWRLYFSGIENLHKGLLLREKHRCFPLRSAQNVPFVLRLYVSFCMPLIPKNRARSSLK